MVQVCHSEMEARKKWCPFARAWDGPVTPAIIASSNRGTYGEPHHQCLCLGSGCMAWRYVLTHIENPKAPGGDLIPSHDSHGFCGLAGPAPKVVGG